MVRAACTLCGEEEPAQTASVGCVGLGARSKLGTGVSYGRRVLFAGPFLQFLEGQRVTILVYCWTLIPRESEKKRVGEFAVSGHHQSCIFCWRHSAGGVGMQPSVLFFVFLVLLQHVGTLG